MKTYQEKDSIIQPPIDDLLAEANSKYALVIFAAKRARQINAYYSQLNEGLLENVGPLVETKANEKPLSIALREIIDGQVVARAAEAAADAPALEGESGAVGESEAVEEGEGASEPSESSEDS